jgi:diguanylate cyclase (GGDEF)-like protein
MSRRRPREVEPATDRVLVLQGVRLVIAVALPAIAALTGDFEMSLVPLALAYVLVIGAAELARRRVPGIERALVTSMVLVDGIVLTVAVVRTGGYRSPLLFLVFLLVLAVTLLVSYRVGLELAAWCALLLLLAHAASEAGVIRSESLVSDRFAFVSAATFLVFALCAATFSWVNERVLRHSRAQLEWLVELTTELERSHRTEDAMAALVRHVCGRLGFTRAVVLTKRGHGWWGVVDDGVIESLVETHADGTPRALEWLSSSSPLLVRSLEDELLDAVLPDARNVVIAPVIADDERFGIVVGEWGGRVDAQIPVLTVRALAQAAMHTASALHTAALLDEVERLATRDSLTGIANRRLFDESLAREAARAQRLRTSLSLIVFDVDHFKQINDAYGHLTGDEVLRSVANSIVATTKSFDVAARYGGDEFVLLLPGCDTDQAMNVAERVRSEIGRHGLGTSVTLSAGLATMPDNAIDGDRLLSAADAALYEAKRSGRDRVAPSIRVAERSLPALVRLEDAPFARGA